MSYELHTTVKYKAKLHNSAIFSFAKIVNGIPYFVVVFLVGIAGSAVSENNINNVNQFRGNRSPMAIGVNAEASAPPHNMRRNMRFVDNIEDARKIADDIRNSFEIRMQKINSRMQLTAEQMDAWDEYVQSNRDNLPSAEMILTSYKESRDRDNTPEKVRQGLANMRLYMDKMQRSVDAYDKLYKICTSDQQKVLQEFGFGFEVSVTKAPPK